MLRMRKTRVNTVAMSGCYICMGDGTAKWEGKNAVALAARHHDATGHKTWAEQVQSITYGDEA